MTRQRDRQFKAERQPGSPALFPASSGGFSKPWLPCLVGRILSGIDRIPSTKWGGGGVRFYS